MNFFLILDVMRFEFRRSVTKGRLFIWIGLILFPVIIFGIMNTVLGPKIERTQRDRERQAEFQAQPAPFNAPSEGEIERGGNPRAQVIAQSQEARPFDEDWSRRRGRRGGFRNPRPQRRRVEFQPETFQGPLYLMTVEVMCMLGLLLWASSTISTEIEGQTWIYLAMRSSGRTAVLCGKYLNAVFWSFSGAVIAISLCVVLFERSGGFRLWAVLCTLAFLSCVMHAAMYVLIGVIFHRRTMAMALVYTVIFEYGIALLPAVAGKFTGNLHLRSLFIKWMNWDFPDAPILRNLQPSSVSFHIGCLIGLTAIALAASLWRLGTAEYPTQQDG